MAIVQEYKYTLQFMHAWGNKVTRAIKNRIKADGLVDTGALLNSIDYRIEYDNGSIPDLIFIMGDGKFNYERKPATSAEYGVFQDEGTKNKDGSIRIKAHWFFTAPIPGLTQKDYMRDLKVAIAKDQQIFIYAQLKEYQKELNELNARNK